MDICENNIECPNRVSQVCVNLKVPNRLGRDKDISRLTDIMCSHHPPITARYKWNNEHDIRVGAEYRQPRDFHGLSFRAKDIPV